MLSGEPCPYCGGDGFAHYQDRPYVYADWRRDGAGTDPCPECHGSGMDQEEIAAGYEGRWR